MGLFVFGCFLLGLYLVYKAIPIFSKPWRVKVVRSKHSRYNNTVEVWLVKRFTFGEYDSGDRIVVKDGIIVSDEKALSDAISVAKDQARVLANALKANRKIKLPRFRKKS